MPRYCGKKQGEPTEQSDGAFFRVTFRSNHIYDAQGFKAVYAFHKGELLLELLYSKTCVKRPLINRQNRDLNDKWQLNEGRKYCRMLPFGAFCNTFDLH